MVSTVINESSRTALELDCEQSLFCSKILGEERKSSESASVTTSVTCVPMPTLLAAPGFTTNAARMSRSQVEMCTALRM